MIEANEHNSQFWKRVILKGLLAFLVIDFLFALLNPLPAFGSVSAYNLVFPGRPRLPYGEVPDQAYNLSLYNLDAMFASHALAAGEKPASEYRVLLIGDSSVWGYLLKPGDTLAAYINAAEIHLGQNQVVKAYNLGYPTMSVTKDLLILRYAMRFKPDLIIWLVTLESLPVQKQLDSPILQNNPSIVRDLISQYSLNLDSNDARFSKGILLANTLVGQRRALADMLRLQLYGVMWAATGVDQYYPSSYDPPQKDLEGDENFHALQPPTLFPQDLALDVLSAGTRVAGSTPIIYVNEPIYLSQGQNSDIRYNFFYPRWAYDQYRQLLAATCQEKGWSCLDEWNLVPAQEFTNSAIHMTPSGTQMLAAQLIQAIITLQQP